MEAKIWFSGYYKCQKSPKNSFSPSNKGLACSDGGAIATLVLPWCHHCFKGKSGDTRGARGRLEGVKGC